MTAELTLEAQRRLDRYLAQVRVLLHGTRNLDAAEVERDVREHIQAELGNGETPVSVEELESVLRRLGSPTQWVGEDEVPPWRRALARLHGGEDWRLAYLCLGATALGFLLLFAGTPIALAFFAGGFFLARAAVSLAEERDEPLGARRWLVLPSLAVVVLPVLVALFVGPLIGLGQVGYDEGLFAALGLGRPHVDPLGREIVVRVALVALGSGLWWLALAGAWGLLRRPVAVLSRPLYVPRPAHRRWILILGLVLTALGVAALLLIGGGYVLASTATTLVVG